MPSTNWRVPSVPVQMRGQVTIAEAAAAAGRGGGGWRNHLPSGSRHQTVYKIMDTLRKHHPFSGLEGLIDSLDLKRTALLLEEKIFTAATSKEDYLRMVFLKMLDFEMKYQNRSYIRSCDANDPIYSSGEFHGVLNNNNILSTASASGTEGSDWRIGVQPQARQRIVNKIMQTLTMHLPCYNEEGLQQLKIIASKFEEYIYAVATGQCDYLRKISLKMISVELRYGHLMANSHPSTSASSSTYPLNPGYAPVQSGPTNMSPDMPSYQ